MFANLVKAIRRFARNRRGGTAIEYGLIVSLVVIAIIGALQSLASETTSMWNDVANKVERAR
ncbi:Flp family type IVb pilin [Sphingomonas sp. FW199]|uniref:Flp family type IVb pilin n=1 Tax=unclassified Sphingomonas TaxID=196159 RepID=UPI0021A60234|nr:Flp family type IVb pilin [Sphingomonas sp. BGYR3]